MIRQAAYRLRKRDPNADGLAFWQTIRQLLEPYDDEKATWNPALKTEQYASFKETALKKLPERDEAGKLIENHHFLLQTVRLPDQELNLRKLMQVALNVGQLLGTLQGVSVSLLVKFIKLDMFRLDTYVDESVFDGIITDDLIRNVSKRLSDVS